jgi:hypothetical protein
MILIELNKFNKVIYKDRGHKYIMIDTGELLDSVTQVKGTYKTKFRKKYWLTYKVLRAEGHKAVPDNADFVPNGKIKVGKNSYTPTQAIKKFNLSAGIKDLEKEWEYKKDCGLCLGTVVHNYLENRWFNKVFPISDPCYHKLVNDENFKDKLMDTIHSARSFYNDHKHLVPVRAEFIVYDEEWGVAGQIDLLAMDPKTEQLYIIDYKTDDKITTENSYQKLRGPLNHLDECSLNEYSLQLNMYKVMLEKNTSLKVSKIYIVSFSNEQYEMFEAKDLEKEAIKILENGKFNK